MRMRMMMICCVKIVLQHTVHETLISISLLSVYSYSIMLVCKFCYKVTFIVRWSVRLSYMFAFKQNIFLKCIVSIHTYTHTHSLTYAVHPFSIEIESDKNHEAVHLCSSVYVTVKLQPYNKKIVVTTVLCGAVLFSVYVYVCVCRLPQLHQPKRITLLQRDKQPRCC